MSHELMYTSVPKGLRTGSMGYCTVAVTQNCPSLLQEKLENLSGYRHLFSPFDLNAKYNPVCLQHVRMNIGGKTYSILSGITDAGIDYSKRSNKFAHHVALEGSECPAGNPAWALAQPEFLQKKWDGDPRTIAVGRAAPAGGAAAGVAQAWKQLTGDAGWAGAIAEAYQKDPSTPFYLIFDPGTNVLPLFIEAIALLPREKQWQVTFSTYYQAMSADVQCAWRAVARHSPEAQQAVSRKLPRIDLAQAGTAPEGDLVHLARTGERLKTVSKPASKPQPSPISPVPLPDTFAFADRGDDDEPAEEAPVLLPRPKKPLRKQMSLKTFDEKRMETREPVEEEEEAKSKLPLFIAIGVFILLLLFGGIVAIVVTLSGGEKEQAQATQPVAVNNALVNNGQNKGGEVNPAKGVVANDGSVDDLEKEDAAKKEERRKKEDERIKEEERRKEEEQRKEEERKKKGDRFPGTEQGNLGAKPPVKVDNDKAAAQGQPDNQRGSKPGFQIVADGVVSAPPLGIAGNPAAGNNTKPADPKPTSEFIPVIYHPLPVIPKEINGPIELGKFVQECRSICFLDEKLHESQSLDISIDLNVINFKKKRPGNDPLLMGFIQAQGQSFEYVPTNSNGSGYTREYAIDVVEFLKSNPILMEDSKRNKFLHAFVEPDQFKHTRWSTPLVIQFPQRDLPSIEEENDSAKPLSSTIGKENGFLFASLKLARDKWAPGIMKAMKYEAVLGDKSTRRIFNEMDKLRDEDNDLLRKIVSIVPEFVYEKDRFVIKTLIRYVGPKPAKAEKNNDKKTEAENKDLRNRVYENSPSKIVFYDVKIIGEYHGMKFIVWQLEPQNKPKP